MKGVFDDLSIEEVDRLVDSDSFSLVVPLPAGGQLAFASFGDPTGFPLLFFPGVGAGRVLGITLHPEAKSKGYRVLCVDRPGIGLSTDHDKDNRTREFCVRLRHALQALNIRSMHVGGHCCGAVYAMATTVFLKDMVVGPAILFSPWVSPSLPGTSSYVRFASEHIPATLVRMGTALNMFGVWTVQSMPSMLTWQMSEAEKLSASGPVGSHVGSRILAQIGQGNTSGVSNDVLLCLEKGEGFGFRTEELEVPLQIFHGTADTTVPLQAVQAFAAAVGPLAQLHVHQHATHNIFMDREAMCAAFQELVPHKPLPQ